MKKHLTCFGIFPQAMKSFLVVFEVFLEQGVQLAESSLRMCTDHEEITPESLLASKKKNEGRRNERKVFELSSQSVFYSPATEHTETKKLGKLTVRSPPKRRE
jgi:hypothetical protein